ncbi:MAG: PIG-L family deacetylase, partial [Candidatus Berkelbacteria bacterium]|nr:PIG-L family deacetylase [Candidatus Berkelbacteria bacterium]
MFWQKESTKNPRSVILDTLRVIIIGAVKADKVLVLAPHPDDDALEIKVIYFSDGSKGNKSGKSSASLIVEREAEAREAGKVLGIGEEKFLRLPDGKIEPTIDLAAQIRREIEFDKPDLILAPSMEELHPDHFAVAEALAIGLKNYDGQLNIWLYEVWGASRFNRLFVIDEYINDKRQALKC